MPTGRKPKTLTTAQREKIETLASVLSQDQIAAYLKMDANTFRAIMEREPDVFQAYKRGKASAIYDIAQSLIAKAREGDTASMIFFLKTQAGWRETDRLEVSGVNGGPIRVEWHVIDPKA
jgi:hypothetical protein